MLEHYQTHGAGELRVDAWDYNSYHQPLHYTNALSEVTTYTYKGDHLLATLTTPAGLLLTYTYDTSGFLNKVVDSVSGTAIRTNGWSWSNAQMATHTNELGMKRSFTWDGLNRITQISFPDSTTIQNWYTNGSGSKIIELGKTTDRRSKSTYFTYNSLRQLTDVQDPLGHITHYDYCSCGDSPEYIKQAYGTGVEWDTHNVYDYQGNVTQTYFPGSVAVTNYYDSLRRLTKATDALSTNTFAYDNLGRLLTITNQVFGQVRTNSYDTENQLIATTDQNGVAISMTYDNLHRLRSRTFPDAGVEAFGYTANVTGATSYTNQISKVTTWAYDAMGRKTTEVIVGIMTNSFTYDPGSNLSTLTDGKSQVTTWKYDIYSRMTNKTDAAGTIILSNTWNAANLLATRWSKAKGTTSYTYDDVSNLTHIDYPVSTDIPYSYDALNRLTNMVDAAGTTTNSYAANGLLATEEGPYSNDTVTNLYNSAGLRSDFNIAQPVGYWHQAYTYDAAKRVSSITGSNGNYSYAYHGGLSSITAPTRLIQQLNLPNTSYITNFYDTNGRLTETDLKNNSGAILNKHAYTYNAGNQRTVQTRTDGSHVTYTYDDAGQLTTAFTTNVSNVEIASERFKYLEDAAWNITKKTNNTTVTTYTLNNLNQVTSDGTSYTYDKNGNRTAYGSNWSYTYDDENELASAVFTATARADFAYDGLMRLRKRSEYTWTGSNWSLSSETRYLYDGMNVVQERSSSNVPQVHYMRGPDLSSSLQGAGGIGGLVARLNGYSSSVGTWSTLNSYHADGNGNITYIVDSTQAAAATYKYNPFGGTISSSGSLASANIYRFSSKEAHINSGLYAFPYRFYDPGLQRWLSRDPIGEPWAQLTLHWAKFPDFHSSQILYEMIGQNGNLYTFVDNAPIQLTDPLGLAVDWSKWSWGDFWGWGLAGTAGGAAAGIPGGPAGVGYGAAGGAIAGFGGVSLSYCFNNWYTPPPLPPIPGQFDRNYRGLPGKYQ